MHDSRAFALARGFSAAGFVLFAVRLAYCGCDVFAAAFFAFCHHAIGTVVFGAGFFGELRLALVFVTRMLWFFAPPGGVIVPIHRFGRLVWLVL